MMNKKMFLTNFIQSDFLKSKFWWDKFALFMIILGVVELLVWHRWFGYLPIIGGIMMLILNNMKEKKWGIFKPQTEMPLETIRSPRLNILSESSVGYCAKIILRVFIFLCFTSLLTIAGFKIWYWADQGLKKDCYQCSWGQKDCNQTLMDEQEYGSNNMCNDMGNYEIVWKIGGMMGLMGIMLSVFVVSIEIWQIWRVG